MFSPFLLAALLAIFKTAQPATGLLFSAVYLFGVYGFCSPIVILEGKKLTYRTIFGSRSVDLSYVNRVWVTADAAPTLRLQTEGRNAPFSFIIKPFSKADVASIM